MDQVPGIFAPMPQISLGSNLSLANWFDRAGGSLPHFLPGTIAILAAFATRIFTRVLAGIFIASPIAGFRPIRAFLFSRTNFPISGKASPPLHLQIVRVMLFLWLRVITWNMQQKKAGSFLTLLWYSSRRSRSYICGKTFRIKYKTPKLLWLPLGIIWRNP